MDEKGLGLGQTHPAPAGFGHGPAVFPETGRGHGDGPRAVVDVVVHDDGKTFKTIEKVLTEDLGYSLHTQIVKASDFGMPQHRPRLFMIGFLNNGVNFKFPEPLKKLKYTMSDVLGGVCDKDIGYTLRVGGRGSDINDRRNWDSYRVDGKVVRIGEKEGLKMQGFPEWFEFPDGLSSAQAMKQLGNSVAVPAIQAVAEQLIKTLEIYEK